MTLNFTSDLGTPIRSFPATNAARRTWVTVYDGRAGYDVSGGRWQVVCGRHGSILSVDTLKLAHTDASGDPAEFCEDCRTAAAPAIICAWCDVTITPGALPTSHGICPDCETRVRGDANAGRLNYSGRELGTYSVALQSSESEDGPLYYVLRADGTRADNAGHVHAESARADAADMWRLDMLSDHEPATVSR